MSQFVALQEVPLFGHEVGLDVLATFNNAVCYKTVSGKFIAIVNADKLKLRKSLYAKLVNTDSSSRFTLLQRSKLMLDGKYRVYTFSSEEEFR